MSKFSEVLASLGLAPKNLSEANAAHATAKATLDSVAALFTAAGLNLEQMLAAGPDALKAHIEALSGDDEALAEALLAHEELEKNYATAQAALELVKTEAIALQGALTIIGLPAATAEAPITAASVKAALDAHVTKAAALLLAKTGHPGVKHVGEADTGPAVMKRAEWDKLTPDAKAKFFRSGGRITD